MKSMWSPCDSAVRETFISCLMRGDYVKLEPHTVSCPCHQLAAGDVILYPERELSVDVRSRWLQLDKAASILTGHRVQRVVELQLDKGFSAVSVMLARPCGRKSSETEGSRTEDLTVVKSLYKDRVYCMNHMLSSEKAILRDLLTCRASELMASKMGAGFFPWSSLIKSAKNKHFDQQTLNRLIVSKASVKATYLLNASKTRALTNDPCRLSLKWNVELGDLSSVMIVGTDKTPFHRSLTVYDDDNRKAMLNVQTFMTTESLRASDDAKGSLDLLRAQCSNKDFVVNCEQCGIESSARVVAKHHPAPVHGRLMDFIVSFYRTLSKYADNFAMIHSKAPHVKVLIESPSENVGYITGSVTLTLLYGTSVLDVCYNMSTGCETPKRERNWISKRRWLSSGTTR
ncbi:hypothetical protein Q5P01_010551 [Channa striata]|uniref:Uncharacterized protein n=1 Tax=Channa striata TaxID=64152 RepID=A0AA88N004_CHASR|nr:hypothetical protein Q5P01_010551 [Channa striata]